MDLVSTADIADLAGVRDSTVCMWAARHADFPAPVAVVARGRTPIYSLPAIREWLERTGRA
jgi:hypothetical protein